MTDYLLLILSVFANVTYSSLCNHFGKTAVRDTRDVFRINFWIDVCVSVMLLGYVIVTGAGFSLFTVLLGLVFGSATALGAVCKLKALENGPMSLTVLFVTASLAIPSFSGALFWNEPLALPKTAGVFVMILAGYLAAGKSDAKTSRTWLAFCVGAFLFIGSVGVLQKVHQTSPYREQKASFLFVAFVTAALICGLLSLRPKEQRAEPVFKGKQWLLLAFCAIGLTLNHVINLYLSGVMPAVILYPMVNGGATVLSVLAALFVFREKLTKPKMFALLVALTALALLIFF